MKKLIDIDEALAFKMRIARDQEAMKGRKTSLDKFYEKVITSGLREHYKEVSGEKNKSGK